MKDVANLFGCMVFNDTVMQARLPKDVYKALKRPWRKELIWNLMLPMQWPMQ